MVSRRTDMVRWYPGDLVSALWRRFPPPAVHSIVIMTKFPRAVLIEPVRSTLARYDQVMVQVSITGLGGTALEPCVPGPAEALADLPALVDLTGRPERVAVRVDPIVHWTEGDAVRTNLASFGVIAGQVREAGIRRVKTSLVSAYPKAVRRFERRGLRLLALEGAERELVLAELERQALLAGVALDFCCEPTRPRSACVDAQLLTSLHPDRIPAPADRAAGQRDHCGCSRSVDLAWYASHPCPSGCLYCYANPTLDGRNRWVRGD